jgi:hypothetical protein
MEDTHPPREMRNTYRILVRKPEGRHNADGSMDFKHIGRKDVGGWDKAASGPDLVCSHGKGSHFLSHCLDQAKECYKYGNKGHMGKICNKNRKGRVTLYMTSGATGID